MKVEFLSFPCSGLIIQDVFPDDLAVIEFDIRVDVQDGKWTLEVLAGDGVRSVWGFGYSSPWHAYGELLRTVEREGIRSLFDRSFRRWDLYRWAALQPHEPLHPGAFLRQDVLPALKPCGLDEDDIARAVGMREEDFDDVVLGRRSVCPRLAVALGAVFGNGADFWDGLQRLFDEGRCVRGHRPLMGAAWGAIFRPGWRTSWFWLTGKLAA